MQRFESYLRLINRGTNKNNKLKIKHYENYNDY